MTIIITLIINNNNDNRLKNTERRVIEVEHTSMIIIMINAPSPSLHSLSLSYVQNEATEVSPSKSLPHRVLGSRLRGALGLPDACEDALAAGLPQHPGCTLLSRGTPACQRLQEEAQR